MKAPIFEEIESIIGTELAINFYLVNCEHRRGYLGYVSFSTKKDGEAHFNMIEEIINYEYDNLNIHLVKLDLSDNNRFYTLEYIVCGKQYYEYVKSTFTDSTKYKSFEIGELLGYLTPVNFDKRIKERTKAKARRMPEYSVEYFIYTNKIIIFSGMRNRLFIKNNCKRNGSANKLQVFAFTCYKEEYYTELCSDVIEETERLSSALKDYIPNYITFHGTFEIN